MALSPIKLAYSVDADDAFMFHALLQGKIDLRGLAFEHRRADTATLNALAEKEEADVVAVSLGAYPALAARYLLLPHGASVGRGYGPVVVARKPTSLGALEGRRVAIPGESTTAWLVLRLMQKGLIPVVVPISPFSRVWESLDRGEVDAALLIHEGRLLYQQRGFVQVAELGVWWTARTGLPLPLGVNVIRRELGEARIAQVSRVLSDAIEWALGNRQAVIGAIAGESRGDAALTGAELLDTYLGMYANADTRAMAPDVRRAIEVLFEEASKAGLLSAKTPIAWAP